MLEIGVFQSSMDEPEVQLYLKPSQFLKAILDDQLVHSLTAPSKIKTQNFPEA